MFTLHVMNEPTGYEIEKLQKVPTSLKAALENTLPSMVSLECIDIVSMEKN